MHAGASISTAKTSPLYSWVLKEVGLGESWWQYGSFLLLVLNLLLQAVDHCSYFSIVWKFL